MSIHSWQLRDRSATRLVLVDRIRELGVRGDPIAMLPNRDTLLITGADDARGLTRIIGLAEETLQNPRPLTGIAFRLVGKSWIPFLPSQNSSSFDHFKLLAIQSLGQDYADQKTAMDALNESRGEDVFVAQFSALKNPETGAVRSYCVWSEGVETLLPKTDQIMFFQPKGEEDGEVIGSASWDAAKRVVGHLMEQVEGYPERYRVSGFPKFEQLKAMCE